MATGYCRKDTFISMETRFGEEIISESNQGCKKVMKKTVNIPGDMVGQIIGSQGQNIKAISSRTSTQCSIEDLMYRSGNLMTIKGSRKGTTKAKQIVKHQVNDSQTITMDIPLDMIGRIIGKKGCNIQDISTSTGTYCKINTESTQMTIQGSREGVKMACELVSEQINLMIYSKKNHLWLHKDVQWIMADNQTLTLNIPVLWIIELERLGLKKPWREISLSTGTQCMIGREIISDSRLLTIQGTKMGTINAKEMITQKLEDFLKTADTQTLTIDIPVDMVADIIGKKGRNIQKISASSGTHCIIISESTQMIIQGNSERVEMARELVLKQIKNQRLTMKIPLIWINELEKLGLKKLKKEIRSSTGALCWIGKKFNSNSRLMTIQGTKTEANNAKQMVSQKLHVFLKAADSKTSTIDIPNTQCEIGEEIISELRKMTIQGEKDGTEMVSLSSSK